MTEHAYPPAQKKRPGEAADLRTATLACRCILRLGEPRLPVNPMAMLRRCRGVVLYTEEEARGVLRREGEAPLWPEQLREDVAAFTVGDGAGRWILVWRPLQPATRLRFSLAHELGHIVLGHHPAPDSRPAREEREANAFARHLVMPPPLVARLRGEGKLDWLEQAALVFGVSRTTADIALHRPVPPVEEGLAREVTALLLPEALRRWPPCVPLRWHPV